jgi:uncharacterized phiE125 gp8 family phage protein
LSLSETKTFLRVDTSDDDDTITRIIKTATGQCELYIGKSLITKKYKLSLYGKAENFILLPYGPVQSIDSVKKVDEEANEEVVSSDNYHLDAESNKIILGGNLYGYKIEVIYISGYGVASDVPDDIKQGLLMHIAKMYDDRNGYSSIPQASIYIYNRYRSVKI